MNRLASPHKVSPKEKALYTSSGIWVGDSQTRSTETELYSPEEWNRRVMINRISVFLLLVIVVIFLFAFPDIFAGIKVLAENPTTLPAAWAAFSR